MQIGLACQLYLFIFIFAAYLAYRIISSLREKQRLKDEKKLAKQQKKEKGGFIRMFYKTRAYSIRCVFVLRLCSVELCHYTVVFLYCGVMPLRGGVSILWSCATTRW